MFSLLCSIVILWSNLSIHGDSCSKISKLQLMLRPSLHWAIAVRHSPMLMTMVAINRLIAVASMEKVLPI